MTRLVVDVGPRDHVLGSPDARITLVQYGDFECPDCGRAHPVLRAVREAFGPNLRFVFRHFPLIASHPHAALAAEASEAAGAQGRFWEMHDRLYERQAALAAPDLERHARKLGLDAERVARELAAHVHAPHVREDAVGGTHSGIRGTPTFFVNGTRYDGVWDDRAAFVEALARIVLTPRG
jgi:protein-disulfide isomerase